MITQSELLNALSQPINIPANGSTFPKLIEEFAYMSEAYTRTKIKEYIEFIDYQFRYSPRRSENYYVKDYKPRTIITMYGEITYYRTIYWDRLKRCRYTYVDERLGIDKWIRYTNDVAAYVTEAYSDENSMIKVGIEIGNLVHCKFSLKDNRIYALPRQTISNLMKRSKEIRIRPLENKREVTDLYVLMDEKYLPEHKDIEGNRKSKMIKSSLIVEGLDKSNKQRHKYIQPKYFSSYRENFQDSLLTFIDDRYELDRIKHIHVLADGATWIKSVSNDIQLPTAQHTNYLDKFHYSQAMWRITKDEKLYKTAMSYLYHNDKKNLYQLFDALGDNQNTQYIKNNWKLIQNTIHLKGMNCAMEQCISHHIHSQFNNVPKVYGKDNINRYLALRDNYRNKENIKELFLQALDDNSDSEITTINKYSANFEDFDKQVPLPYYTASLKNGKKPVCFTPHDDYRFLF